MISHDLSLPLSLRQLPSFFPSPAAFASHVVLTLPSLFLSSPTTSKFCKRKSFVGYLITTMLGMATLTTLGSSTAMAVVAQSQAQPHATTLTSAAIALPGSKRLSLSNRTHSLPMGLVSNTNQNCTFVSSFKKPFTSAVASVDSDNISSSDDPATKVSFTPSPH